MCNDYIFFCMTKSHFFQKSKVVVLATSVFILFLLELTWPWAVHVTTSPHMRLHSSAIHAGMNEFFAFDVLPVPACIDVKCV